MASAGQTAKLDRHALVMALWLASALVAATLFDFGLGAGGVWAIAAAFGVVIAAFVGHVIVNAVYATGFTPRELVLGLVLFGAGLVAFVLATLLVPGYGERHFAVMSLGFLALFVVVMFYMITHYGVRRVFDAFDVVSEFRPRDDRGSRP